MDAKELYIELQNPMYAMYGQDGNYQCPYQQLKDWGENMEIIEESINGYWYERFLVDHNAKEAYELMNRQRHLTFVGKNDVDWDSVKTLKNNENAYIYSAYYPQSGVGKFKNGVARVRWVLYPDGEFFRDEDGYGMEFNNESALYGYIDKKARVIIPFQAIGWEDAGKLRPEAERRAKELSNQDIAEK